MVRAKLSLRENGVSLGETTKSLGPPGEAPDDGVNSNHADRRSDYLALWLNDQSPRPKEAADALALDDRKTIPLGERVWLPFVDYQNGRQQTLEEGTVTDSRTAWTLVTLDRRIQLSCESGSPIISQSTGLVIGTLSSGANSNPTRLFLAPAYAIRQALAAAEDANSTPLLSDNIGKK
jgi:hypothetical protein